MRGVHIFELGFLPQTIFHLWKFFMNSSFCSIKNKLMKKFQVYIQQGFLRQIYKFKK